MQCPLNLIIMCVALCVVLGLAVPCCCDPLARGPENMARPIRPTVFNTPEELRTYLQELSDYYAVAGKPRFGKRLVLPSYYKPNSFPSMYHAVATIPKARYPASPSELYDMLSQYDE